MKGRITAIIFILISGFVFSFEALGDAKLICADENNWSAEAQPILYHFQFYQIDGPQISCREKEVYEDMVTVLYGTWTLATLVSICDPTIVLSKTASWAGYQLITGLKIFVTGLDCKDYDNEKEMRQAIREEMCDLARSKGENCDPKSIDISRR